MQLVPGLARSSGKEEKMNKAISSLIAIGAAALCVSAAPRDERDQDRLAAALRNYEQSGPATDCVRELDLGGNKSAGNAIIFEAKSSSRLWVNRPSGGCPGVGGGLALVFRTPIDRLCRGDIANVVDPVSHISSGTCVLGDFTPYHRISRR
jgi:hypothetical protein